MNGVLKKELILEGLNCANCALKIENEVKKIDKIEDITLNFVSKKLSFNIKDSKEEESILNDITSIIKRIEPDVNIKELNKVTLEPKEEKDEIKGEILKIAIGVVFFLFALIFKKSFSVSLALYIVSYLLIGGEVLIKAVKNIKNGQIFDENFLMAIATIGAFSIKQFPEAVSVMLFYQIGELFQDMAVDRSRKSILSLMDIRPDYANIKLGEDIKKVSPSEVHVGDIIVVKAGEKIPLDGVVIEGRSMVDTLALTGESIPREVEEKDEVLSGFINKNGLLTIKVTKELQESTVSKIMDLVENASNKKASTENFITKFAKIYTPIVVLTAAIIAVLPPIINGEPFYKWLYRALIFLVVSCPCALVISIPLGFFGGIGGASKKGILVKGGNYLEALNNVDTVVFDKTGTLTKGVFEVTKIKGTKDIKEEELLKYAAYGEYYSNHPIAQSVVKAYKGEIDKELIKNYEEVWGKGTIADVNEQKIFLGNNKLMKEHHIDYEEVEDIGTVLYVAINKKYAGYMVISDEIKEDSKKAISNLKEIGIKETVMLTGDSSFIANKIGSELNIDKVYGGLLPQEKVEKLEEIEKSKSKKGKVLFVGDGINDAPVLKRADIGVAMGGLGSDAAIEAADVVIMTDEPSKIFTAIKIAKKTRKIVWENIGFAIAVKVLVLVLGAFGIATMWEAVFADVGVALLATLNSTRVIKNN